MRDPYDYEIEANKYFYVEEGCVFYEEWDGWSVVSRHGTYLTMSLDPHRYELRIYNIVALNMEDPYTQSVLQEQLEEVAECSCVYKDGHVETEYNEVLGSGKTQGEAMVRAMVELYKRNGYDPSQAGI